MSPDDDRLAALERQVAALTAEVARLRVAAAVADPPPPAAPHHDAFSRASAAAAALGADDIESLVGRYGTLLLGAFVLLMGVGVLIQFAVTRGLLTPAVRVGLGALTAAGVGAAGVYFHRRGEVRYANALLAVALALTDLVAWGAGPRLHLVPDVASLGVVFLVAVALAALALHDRSEFLFSAAVAGALSAPFVAAERIAAPDMLLVYGALVLVGSLRAVRDPRWERAFVVLVGGALVYALAALSVPNPTRLSPFGISLFGGACALAALLLAQSDWRSGLARAFLAVGLVGVPAAWDRIPAVPPSYTWGVALALAAVTYAALAVRRRSALWTASALALPFVSLGIASAWSTSRQSQAAVFALWAAFALAAWRAERLRDEPSRGGAHLAAGALLGTAAIGWALWPSPYLLVSALAGWGVLVAVACRDETRALPLVGVAVPLGAAALAAVDQLASRQAFAYAPFATRSSASALSATVGFALAGLVLGRSEGAPAKVADRAVRLAVPIGFAILWGRMEVAGGWTPDIAAFLLIAYYGACGVGSILAGRRYGVGRLRLAGLGLAIYAAVKAIMEASLIGELMLRVGAYGAVGVFLLAAGYIYREAGRGGGESSA
jgi:hypothetical protein